MSATREEMLAEENRRLRQQNEALQSQAQALQSEKQTLQSQAQALQTQVQELEIIRRNLEHTVAVYKRCLFGSRSEKIDPQELEARIAQAAAEAREQLAQEKRPGDPPPEAEEEKPEEKAAANQPADQGKKRKARPHGRSRFPAHLPRRRIAHPVDPAQTLCAGCSDHPPLIHVGEDTSTTSCGGCPVIRTRTFGSSRPGAGKKPSFPRTRRPVSAAESFRRST